MCRARWRIRGIARRCSSRRNSGRIRASTYDDGALETDVKNEFGPEAAGLVGRQRR